MNKEAKRILLVEGSLADAQSIGRLIESFDHIPMTFMHVDGLEKALAELANGVFDAIVLSLNLPDSKGVESIRRLQAKAPAVPIVALTSLEENGLALEALEAGAEDNLVKEQIDVGLLSRSIRFAIERKHIEVRFNSVNAKYRSLIDRVPAIIYAAAADDLGSKIFVSPRIERSLGFTEEEWLADPDLWSKQLHPDDRDRVLAEFTAARRSRQPFKSEYRLISRSGRTLWFHDEATIDTSEVGSPQCYQGVMVDLTAQKESEKTLRKLQKAIGQSRDVIFVTDTTGIITYVNLEFSSLYGFKPEEVIGVNSRILKSGVQGRETYTKFWNTIAGGKTYKGEFVNKTKDGRLVSVEVTVDPVLDTLGNITGYIAIQRDTTARKQEEELHESHHKLNSIVDNLRCVVYRRRKDRDWTMEYMSGGIYELSGYSADEFTANRIRSYNSIIEPNDQPIITDEIQDALAENRPYVLEYRIRTAGGEQKWVWERGRAVFDGTNLIGLEGFISDITDRRIAEENLRASEERFRSVWNNSADGVRLTDRDGRIMDVNEAYCRMVRMPRETLLGRMFSITYKQQGPDDGLREYQRRFDDGEILSHVDAPTTMWNDEVLHLEVSSSIVELSGKERLLLSLFRDVTKQRQLERRFIQAQKMECIGTHACGIAHDFNNILAIVLGHLALVERIKDDEAKFKESIAQISKAVERGAGLVRQIHTFAREADTKLEPVNINGDIKELSTMLNETFPKTIALSLKLDKTIPVISMDQTQLFQILLNLCVNARDAMDGNGTLTIATQLVSGRELRTRFPEARANHYVHASVADTGTGMSEETKSHMFEPFFTTKSDGKGTGLGLAVVYSVVQAHNGFIDAESAPGAGTTFNLYFPIPEGIRTGGQVTTSPGSNGCREGHFILPRDSIESVTAVEGVKIVVTRENKSRTFSQWFVDSLGNLNGRAPDRIRSERSEEWPGGDETILVVEDEPTLRDLLVEFLESVGYTVILANDGDEAVALYRARKDDIDLVITDMGLPKRNGWETLKLMQRVDSNVRAILTTVFIEPRQKSEILESGIRTIVSKPYHVEEILKAVRETLDDRPRKQLTRAPENDPRFG